MKTIRTKVYSFSELNEDAKQVAIEWYRYADICDYSIAWETTEEDAKEIGLKLIQLSDHKANKGEFLLSANEVAQNIFNNHGADCQTYKTAQSFMEEWQPIFTNYMDENHTDYESGESEDKMQELEDSFLYSLLEDYRIMYNADIDYQNTDEYIIEAIEANQYNFTKDGKIFNY